MHDCMVRCIAVMYACALLQASIAGIAAAHPDPAVVWVDAHADANTPATSPSGHYHGMPAAHLMDLGLGTNPWTKLHPHVHPN
jgi:arginase family enzyme